MSGTIVSGCRENIIVQWDATNKKESFTLLSGGEAKFQLVCSARPRRQEAGVLVRFTDPGPEAEVVRHPATGETHALRLSASENILVSGLGLAVCRNIDKVVVSIRRDDALQSTIFSKTFANISPNNFHGYSVLPFDTKVFLSSTRMYAIVLEVFGGASFKGVGGEEFIEADVGDIDKKVLFKFDDYYADAFNKTDVETGLISKIFFDVDD